METTAQNSAHRRILLAVTGLTPQVVTETLYALACHAKSPWVPDEVHLITTTTGAENARLNLIANPDCWFHRLCADYGLTNIRFDAGNIHVLKDQAGQPLEDIRTQEENTQAANFITEMVRELTSDPDSEVHVSIAGGRKTMGFYLGYALSLFGRPQDRLSHVLVSDPFESNRHFYYPTPYDYAIHVRRGEKEVAFNARDAQVELAEIPFVSLRHGLPSALQTGSASFRTTVEAARRALGPASLELDPVSRRVRAGEQVLTLAPAQFAVLAVLAWRARNGAGPMKAPIKDAADEQWSAAFLADLQCACGEMHAPDRIVDRLREGVDGNWFSPHLTRLRQTLHAALGQAAVNYLPPERRSRAHSYQLPLKPENIRFGHIDPTVTDSPA